MADRAAYYLDLLRQWSAHSVAAATTRDYTYLRALGANVCRLSETLPPLQAQEEPRIVDPQEVTRFFDREWYTGPTPPFGYWRETEPHTHTPLPLAHLTHALRRARPTVPTLYIRDPQTKTFIHLPTMTVLRILDRFHDAIETAAIIPIQQAIEESDTPTAIEIGGATPTPGPNPWTTPPPTAAPGRPEDTLALRAIERKVTQRATRDHDG